MRVNNKGQTVTEYVLLFCVVLMIVFKYHDAINESLVDERHRGNWRQHYVDPPIPTNGPLPVSYP